MTSQLLARRIRTCKNEKDHALEAAIAIYHRLEPAICLGGDAITLGDCDDSPTNSIVNTAPFKSNYEARYQKFS